MSLKSLFSSLLREKAGVYDPTTTSFRQLDAGKISEQYQLTQLGKERGRANIPSAASVIPDDIEQKIVSLIKAEEREAREICNDNLKVLTSRLGNLAAESKLNELSNIADKIEGDFSLQVHQTGFPLYLARQNVTKSEETLNAFKLKHSLNREPVYPKSRFKNHAFIALLVVLETIMNGYFFSQHNEMGWLGGVTISFVLSLVNITLGCLLGSFGYRLVTHKFSFFKTVGFLVCATSVLTILTVNLSVAHYRSIMSKPFEVADFAEPETKSSTTSTETALTPIRKTPQVLAFESFREHPFAIDDMESWLLIMLGCGLSLFASYKVFRSDDPYFRYGEVARHRAACIHEYGEMVTDMLEDIRESRDMGLDDLQQTFREINSARGESISIRTSYNNWNNLFMIHLQHLEETGKILISEYRHNNMAARTEDAPKFFKKEWTLDKTPLENNSADFDRQINEIEATIEKSQQLYAQAAQKIKMSYDASKAAYQTIEELQPSQVKPEEFQKWLTDQIKEDGNVRLAVVA